MTKLTKCWRMASKARLILVVVVDADERCRSLSFPQEIGVSVFWQCVFSTSR